MLQKIKEKGHYQAFFITLALAAVVFLPFIIYDKGIFFFYGDFNVQQIPFYKLAHEAIRSGDIAWNWYTDLGANFIGSYSFYLLFSPFFWLTLPFPTEAVPFLIGPLLMLKTACAALTSYFYIKRFVKDQYYAVIGSILYAFSGFAVYNIFFNHFHEVIVFFPLLLIGVEELVTNNRKGLFAITVAINCLVNYWFFIGEVVFVVLYVFIRMADRDWGMTVKKFITLAFESVVGLMIAMFLLLPSVLAILGNPRTGTDNLLMGWWFWVFDNEQRLPAILQCFFFPPELPSSPNFFPDHGAKWSFCGVAAHGLDDRRHRLPVFGKKELDQADFAPFPVYGGDPRPQQRLYPVQPFLLCPVVLYAGADYVCRHGDCPGESKDQLHRGHQVDGGHHCCLCDRGGIHPQKGERGAEIRPDEIPRPVLGVCAHRSGGPPAHLPADPAAG